MKTFKDWMVIPTALAMLLTSAGVARTQTPLTANFQPDPLEFTGTSANKACSNSGATPNHVINLSDDFSYLRFSVQSSGQPTLLIEGPSGSSCVQADNLSGGKIEAPGYWEKGTYRVYVGDRAGGQNSYTLRITRTR